MSNDRQRRVNDFVQAFHRLDALVADNLNLDLTVEEMQQIKERIVYLWVIEKLTGPYNRAVFDAVLSQPGFGGSSEA